MKVLLLHLYRNKDFYDYYIDAYLMFNHVESYFVLSFLNYYRSMNFKKTNLIIL